MEDIEKWFVDPYGGAQFEIEVEDHAEAIAYVEKNFSGSGEVRIIKVVYKAVSQYSYIVDA